MFFKNLTVFRLPRDWQLAASAGSLAAQLDRAPFVKCPSNQPMSRGWVSPRKNGDLLYQLGRQILIALKVEEKLLPAAVVNEEVRERAAAMEDQQGYAPGRKQMKELRERVTEELLQKAFTTSRVTFAWIDPVAGWLAIDTSSQARAEEVIEQLRHCLDDFPLEMLHTQVSPTSAMADWLAGEAPGGFTIDRDCELKAVGEEKAAVRYVRHPLDGEEIAGEIKDHLASGKLPVSLALTWNDRISFVLGERCEIKRLTFLDILKADNEADNAEEQFDSDFAIMTGELGRFLDAMVAALGGEVVEGGAK